MLGSLNSSPAAPRAPPDTHAELSRRVGKAVAYPTLCEFGEQQRREFHELLLGAGSFLTFRAGTTWSVKGLAGDELSLAVYSPEDDRLVVERRSTVEHYEVD